VFPDDTRESEILQQYINRNDKLRAARVVTIELHENTQKERTEIRKQVHHIPVPETCRRVGARNKYRRGLC
jgi:hypothetical protein